MSTRIPKNVRHEGQQLADLPVRVGVRKELTTQIAASVREVFGTQPPAPIETGREVVRLNWLKPDGNGGLKSS